MTWSKFDDAAAKSPKAMVAGNEAWSLWSAAIMYCNRHLTDGYVSLAALATECLPVPIPLAKAKKLAEQLCASRARPEGAGLFEEAGNQLFKVHDFLDWNPSKAEVEAKRKADRDRKRRGPDSGGESGGGSGVPPRGIPNGKRRDSVPPRASARALPDPSRPDPAKPDQQQPSAVVGDFDSETSCPLDLVSRLETAGVFTELADSLHVSAAALKEEAESTVAYWTIGKGMGRKRRNWPGMIRQRLVERARAGEIRVGDDTDEGPPPEVRARLAQLRGGIG